MIYNKYLNDIPPSVLLICFNRPDKTKLVLDSILSSRIKKLYIAIDGPRNNNLNDILLCNQIYEMVNKISINNNIEIHTLFRNKNLGCKIAVSKAIDWFFENEEEGIILEDDTIPNNDFFIFCSEMLNKYRNVQNIGMICGSNLISDFYKCEESYFFSKYNPIWGWATWKRAWNHFDVNMSSWKNNTNFEFFPQQKYKFNYWNEIFNSVYNDLIDTWDYQWTYACWSNNLLSIIPKYNLIKNIGFDESATHTKHSIPSFVISNPQKDLIFPLKHPQLIIHLEKIDRIIEERVYNLTFLNHIKRKINKILKKNYGIKYT